MAEENKEKDQPLDEAQIVAGEKPVEEEQPPSEAEAVKESPATEPSLAQKRGRMVTAGILTAVIASMVVVVTAGIFHLVAGTLKTCPKDLPVNDPAPVLWEKVEAGKLGDQPLGVKGRLLTKTGFKGESSSDEDSAGKRKNGEPPK